MKTINNIWLMVILGLLIVVSAILGSWEGTGGGIRVDADLFVIENIDPIDRVVISHGQETTDCRAFSGGFMVNDKFPMDENLLTVLAAVLQQVRVQRPVAGSQREQLLDDIQNSGSHVEVYTGQQLINSFWVGGDESKQQTYFATEEGEVYLVELPGYTSYLSGLFKLPAKDWRSRTVFFNTWRSLMSFSYQDFINPENDFQINYRDPFFEVPGVQQLDSNNVMNYLQTLVNLKAAALVDTSYQGMPLLELVTTDIDPLKNQTLTLYGDASQPMVLGKAGEQFFTFRGKSLEPIIKTMDDFERSSGDK